MDENTTKNTKKKKIILFAAIAVALIALLIIIIINFIKPAKHELQSDEDVISYLEKKYPEESFTIMSKESDGWRIQSEASHTIFLVYEKELKDSNQYEATDNYITSTIDIAADRFKSDFFTAKRIDKDSNTLNLYNGDELLVINDFDSKMKSELFKLCYVITNYAPFTNFKEEEKANTVIDFHYIKNGADAYLHCRAGTTSFGSLLE